MVNAGGQRQSKYWCFTWNNYPRNAERIITALATTYYVIGRETGRNGTRHLQGYLELSRKTRLRTLKAETSDGIHWEARLGTGKEASDYCKKDGSFVEAGELRVPEQGRVLFPLLEELDQPIR